MTNRIDLSKFKSCSCGATIESETTEVKYDYTPIGWFWQSMGATAIPKEISFKCNKCDKVFERITEKDIIKYYIYYRKN